MKLILNVAILAAIVALCVLAHECPAGDCRGVLQIQQVYATPVQAVQVQAYTVAQPQFVQRVRSVQLQQVYQPQQVQFVRQKQFVQRVQVVQPQRIIVRERVIDNGGRRNVQVGLFNFGR